MLQNNLCPMCGRPKNVAEGCECPLNTYIPSEIPPTIFNVSGECLSEPLKQILETQKQILETLKRMEKWQMKPIILKCSENK